MKQSRAAFGFYMVTMAVLERASMRALLSIDNKYIVLNNLDKSKTLLK